MLHAFSKYLAPRLSQGLSRASGLAASARRTLSTMPSPIKLAAKTARRTSSAIGSKGKKIMLVGGVAGAMVATAAVASADVGTPMAVSVYDVPLGRKMPDVVPCFIEVSRGSRNKYEWDNNMGFLKLDRVLHSAVFYPHNYGFFPQTLCGDGDPLDVLVMGDLPLVPGSLVDVRPIAYMVMEDEKGMDEKVLAVVSKDPHYVEMKSLRDVPEHVLREIAHFFSTYKALEKKKWVKVGGWRGTEDTLKLIEETHDSYKKKKLEGPIEYAGN
ncbi:hypothetical protein AAMO2058_001367500 [Amorphochlora amoebiformis]